VVNHAKIEKLVLKKHSRCHKQFGKCGKWMTKKTKHSICKFKKCCKYHKSCVNGKCKTKKVKCGSKRKCEKAKVKFFKKCGTKMIKKKCKLQQSDQC